MELNGTLYRVLPPLKGQSARGEWTKQEIIIEMPEEFNRKVCISFWGDKVQDIAQMREGDKVSISVNIESREYNGRWFTEIRAWKVNRQGDAAAAQPPQQYQASAPQAAPQAAPGTNMPPINSFEGDEGTDDLPF